MAYSGVYIFGDSLVDSGNALGLARWYGTLTLSDLPDGAPTQEDGYFLGRFTDGYTFADLVMNKLIGAVSKPVFPYGYEDPWLGIPIAPFASDPSGNNLNFAYGGAQIVRGSEAVLDLDGQTDSFRHAVDGRADPNALYMVTIGGNDVRSLVLSSGEPVPVGEAHAILDAAAERMLTELRQLIEIGVEHIVITGIPDVGLIPRYDRDGNLILEGDEARRAQAASDYSAYLDTLIRTEVVGQLRELGATVTYVQVADVLDADGNVVTPGALSLNLPTLAALHGISADELRANLLEHQGIVFFDQIHPTAQAHALLGAYMHAQLTGTEWVETLPLTGGDVNYAATGAIAVAGEVDRFTVSLVAGTTYTLEMLGMSSLGIAGALADPSLRILAANGLVVAANDDDGAGFDATVTFTAATTGNYTVELTGVGSVAGSYVLQGGDVSGAAMAQGDVYVVHASTTGVMEGAGGVGTDVLRSSLSYTLSAGTEIETLRTTNNEGKTAINLTGNELSQSLVGNAGSNRIDGGGGRDSLWGYAGKDTFVFSSALDAIANVDTLRDFSARDDTIALDDAIFDGLALGALARGAFAKGAAATQADDRIIYDPATGKLYFDEDGVGGASQIHFATLTGAPNIGADDFLII